MHLDYEGKDRGLYGKERRIKMVISGWPEMTTNNHKQDKKDEGILEVDIKGNKCLCVHGHNDRDNSLDRLIEMFEYKPSYIFKGHDHRARIFEKNRTTIICNGAFSGEEYSKNARLYNKSVQIFTIFNEEGMECNYFINLNNYNKI